MEYSTRIYQVYMKYVAPEDIIVSVSYTHLDVYKRQAVDAASRHGVAYGDGVVFKVYRVPFELSLIHIYGSRWRQSPHRARHRRRI